MNATRTRPERAGLAAAALLLLTACGSEPGPPAGQKAAPARSVADPGFPPARPLVPFVKAEGTDCTWRWHAKGKEKWIRGDISRGDENPMIGFVDRAFDQWSDSEDHRIEISVGDPKRRLAVNAWATKGSEAPGSVAFYMDAEMRRLIGGATSLQIWKDGKPVYNTLLARTPSAAELDACIQKPGWDVDSEYDGEEH